MQSNIGIVLEQQGQLEGAEQMYTESLQINLKVFGEDSLNVADAQKDIADVRKAQGRYDEAVKVYTDVLQIQERVLGHNHPVVADTKVLQIMHDLHFFLYVIACVASGKHQFRLDGPGQA